MGGLELMSYPNVRLLSGVKTDNNNKENTNPFLLTLTPSQLLGYFPSAAVCASRGAVDCMGFHLDISYQCLDTTCSVLESCSLRLTVKPKMGT